MKAPTPARSASVEQAEAKVGWQSPLVTSRSSNSVLASVSEAPEDP